jgi:hypothetical protein
LDKQERLKQNTARITELQQRFNLLEQEKQNLMFEATRLVGENRLLEEQIKEEAV